MPLSSFGTNSSVRVAKSAEAISRNGSLAPISLNQQSELAELPMTYIFLAWPLAGFTWIMFLGEFFITDIRTVFGKYWA